MTALAKAEHRTGATAGRSLAKALVGVAAALAAVRIAAAQGQSRDLEAAPTQIMTQTLNGGTTPTALALPMPRTSSSQPGAGLIINAMFDTTITSDPNAAAIENAINTAIANMESMFSDPIAVTISFGKMGSGLAQSSTYFATVSYSAFLAALKADAKTSADMAANAHLASVANNPVNSSSTINVKLPNLRAVAFTANPPAGQPDGFISVNTALTSPGSPGTTGSYYLVTVIEHEIDEVLGLGSSLPGVPAGTIFPEDLFRYGQWGGRSFTVSPVQAFFSIDGSTLLAQFDNQNDGGDFGDWQSNPLPTGVAPKVQDAYATPGANPALSIEVTALDVIGYDRVPPLRPPTNVRIVPGR
jgi:hypothetical protein